MKHSVIREYEVFSVLNDLRIFVFYQIVSDYPTRNVLQCDKQPANTFLDWSRANVCNIGFNFFITSLPVPSFLFLDDLG